MRSDFAAHPRLYGIEYQYPLIIDNTKQFVNIGSILIFNKPCFLSKLDCHCDAGVILRFDYHIATQWFERTIVILPLFS